jgi:hypothetical protein
VSNEKQLLQCGGEDDEESGGQSIFDSTIVVFVGSDENR